MPRGRRLIVQNGIYHVMARGNRKAAIFEDIRDRERFIEIVAEASERYNIDVYAECRVGNHYHAVVRTPDANLSAFMGYVNGVFTQYSNRRHQRSGHLLGERFKSLLVDDEHYLRVVVGYVEMNPVAAGLVASPADWAWSSYRATAGLSHVPCYLSLEWLDIAFPAASRRESQEKYCAYLEAPTLEEAELLHGGPAAGPSQFLHQMRAHIGATFHHAALPRSYRALHRPSLERLFPRGLSKAERASAMLRAHVVHAYRMSEIARGLDLHPNSVSRIISQLRRRAREL